MQMQKLQFIKNLVVEKANYYLEDEAGRVVELVVDYKKNTYEFTTWPVDLSRDFWIEAEQFAKGLLSRKAGANLAVREQYL